MSSLPFRGPNHADSVAHYCSGSLHDPCLMSALLCMTSVDQSLTYCHLLYFPSSLCTFSYCCLCDALKIYLLTNHWYDCFPINTLIHLFLPLFFDVLTLEVGTHSLPKMLVTNQLTCSNAEERRSHLLWITLIWYIVHVECFNEICHLSLISNINMVEGQSQWCAVSVMGVWPLAC